MDIVKVFGSNLKKYITAMGISQEAFADKCGMHRTYISAIECYRRSISLENIQRIADALGIETYKLFWRIKLCLHTLAIIDYRLVIALKRGKILFPVS